MLLDWQNSYCEIISGTKSSFIDLTQLPPDSTDILYDSRKKKSLIWKSERLWVARQSYTGRQKTKKTNAGVSQYLTSL